MQQRQYAASQFCLFGSQDRFAVECEMFPPEVCNYSPIPIGVLYLWAGGRRLGHENESCDLSVPVETLYNNWRRRGTLRDVALNGKPAREALDTFWQARYGDPPEIETGE